MSTNLKNFKKGPVRTIVERELRSLVNSVEALVKDGAYYGRQELLDLFAEAMEERGLRPRQ